jgi:hypothetical protein
MYVTVRKFILIFRKAILTKEPTLWWYEPYAQYHQHQSPPLDTIQSKFHPSPTLKPISIRYIFIYPSTFSVFELIFPQEISHQNSIYTFLS